MSPKSSVQRSSRLESHSRSPSCWPYGDSPDAGASLDRIFVRDSNSVLALLLADIERVEAQDDYVMIHTQRKRYLVSLRIGSLEERLPFPTFLRVYRSHIVNLDHMDRMLGLGDARFEVWMKNGAVVPVSRSRSQEIRRLSRSAHTAPSGRVL